MAKTIRLIHAWNAGLKPCSTPSMDEGLRNFTVIDQLFTH
jgi:hypothetical protein